MKKNFISVFVFVAVFVLNSCQLVDDIFDGKKDENVSFVADISSESEFDFLAYAEEDQSFFAVKLRENSNPGLALFKPNEASEPFPIWFDEDGFPEKMVVEGFIFTFDNFTGETFDMGIVSPDGEVSVVREVHIPAEYQEFIQLKSFNWSDGLRWAGHIAGAVACGASIVAGASGTAASAGIAAPAAAVLITIGCGATALAIVTEVLPEEIQEFTGLPATAVSAFSTTVSCINFVNAAGALSCFAGLTSSTLAVASVVVEEHENDLALAEGAVQGGYGDIQVTLTWDSTADLDLYVQDPNEEWIWFGKKTSASGGWLDVDDIDGFGPENIFWEKNQAPEGNYLVYVEHYSGGSANYSVLVQAFGRVKQFKGYIGRGESIYITDFSKNHLKSGRVNPANVVLPIGNK